MLDNLITLRMDTQKIREDKICRNCGSFVEKVYCPECGQKNTETRKSFYLLLSDFMAGLTNYDNSFWRTARYLITSPGKPAVDYIAGRRKSYINPVQLYLFSSFVVFFMIAILPGSGANEVKKVKKGRIVTIGFDSGRGSLQDEQYGMLSSVAQLDSIHRLRPPKERIPTTQYYYYKFVLRAADKVNNDIEELNGFLVDNLSKAIFIYMPVFAFFLWLFHGKKRWLYFDSCVFTLYFFSLIMIVSCICNLLLHIFDDWLKWGVVAALIFLAALCYVIFYFFRAHSTFYGERKAISRLKVTTLLIINSFFMCITTLLYVMISLLL